MTKRKKADLAALSMLLGFSRGVLKLKSYEWAERIFTDLDRRGASVAVKACNGAGKTSRVAAPAALWNASVFPRSLTIATAGVFRQVKEQLFPSVHTHAHKFRGWTFNDCEVVTHHGSRIIGFSTDDPGRFEGWHNDNLLVIVDEAKSVPDSIFEAMERCQPTRLLLLSSPGSCSGYFYDAFHGRRKFFRQHTVTARDCPHITAEWIAEQVEKYGEFHPLAAAAISGDAGGLGAVMCDALAEAGWHIRRVNNGSPARDAEHYANTAAEMWYEGRLLIERRKVILPNDRELIGQLTARRGWVSSKGKLELESKEQMRGRGLSSPDRADAVLGTMMPEPGGGSAIIRTRSHRDRSGLASLVMGTDSHRPSTHEDIVDRRWRISRGYSLSNKNPL